MELDLSVTVISNKALFVDSILRFGVAVSAGTRGTEGPGRE